MFIDTRRLKNFPPIVNQSCRILILGSMPSKVSLQKRQYYGHPQNHFWKIIGHLLRHKEWADYATKRKTLLENNIALWDVVDSCWRESSLDVDLREVKGSDLKTFIKKYPNIKAVFCNGTTAFSLFRRNYGDIDLPVVRLPSTSPAHTISFGKKLQKWRRIMMVLKEQQTI